jgi:hypothetical protein
MLKTVAHLQNLCTPASIASSDAKRSVAMDAKSRAAESSEASNLGVPVPIADAIKRAAANELISKSAYARRAVLAALQRDGFLDNQQRVG